MTESARTESGRLKLVRDPDREFESLLREKLEAVDADLARLDKERAEAEREVTKLKTTRAHLVGLLGEERAESTPSHPAFGSVGEAVVALISEVDRPLHYRDIERELRSRGWCVATGVDPASTLLAKYYDDPRLVRPSRGTYALRGSVQSQASVGTRRRRRAARART